MSPINAGQSEHRRNTGRHASDPSHATSMPTVRLTYNKRPSNIILNVDVIILIIKGCDVHLQLLLLYYEPFVVPMFVASFSQTKPVFKHGLPWSLLNPNCQLNLHVSSQAKCWSDSGPPWEVIRTIFVLITKGICIALWGIEMQKIKEDTEQTCTTEVFSELLP